MTQNKKKQLNIILDVKIHSKLANNKVKFDNKYDHASVIPVYKKKKITP